MTFLSENDTRDLPLAAYRALCQLGSGRPVTDALALHTDAELRKAAEKIPGHKQFDENQRGLFLPLQALCRGLVTNLFGAAGAFVGTDQDAVEYMLRPFSAAVAAGARVISGLRGNVSIPREVTDTTFDWRLEIETISETDPGVGAIALTPHRLAGATAISSQLETQSARIVSQFLLEALSRGIGAGIDTAALVGSGVSGQPAGVYSSADVCTVTFSGAAVWAKILSYVKQIATNNADDESISFIGHPAVREKHATIQRFTGVADTLWNVDAGTVAGKKAFVTTSMPTTGLIAGDFSKMLIATFGEDAPILINPFTQSLAGRVSFVATVFADIALLRGNVFCKNSDSAVQ
jgi:HK97 family phage major capsid protein